LGRIVIPAPAALMMVVTPGALPNCTIAADPRAWASDAPVPTEVNVENALSSNELLEAVLEPDNADAALEKGQRPGRIRIEENEGEPLLHPEAPIAGRRAVAIYHDEIGNNKLDGKSTGGLFIRLKYLQQSEIPSQQARAGGDSVHGRSGDDQRPDVGSPPSDLARSL